MEDLERTVREIQESILEEARKVYPERVIELFLSPRNLGPLPDPDGYARFTGPCGDTMEIYLRLEGDRIREASFVTDGCGTTVACGSMVTEMVRGRTLREAFAISPERLLEELGGLPEADQHCATLAVETLRRALRDALDQRREPWRRAYRRH